MKKLTLLSLLTIMFSLPAGAGFAFSGFRTGDIDVAFSQMGAKGVVIQGEVTAVQPARLINGWAAIECTVKGIVIKGNDKIPASETAGVYKFKMVDPKLVPGLKPCAKGMRGFLAFYGESRFESTSFVVNGAANIIMKKAPDGKLYTNGKNLRFQNKALGTKLMQAHPVLGKALGSGTVTSAAVTGDAGRLDEAQTATLVKYLVGELYPSSK